MDTAKLIFVYNADSTIFAIASDIVKKIVAPQTQECNLCKITYGALTPKEEWSNFLASLPQEKVFLHRDEFASKYPDKKNIALPAVFVESAGTLLELITAEEMNKAKTISDIITLVTDKIKQAKNMIESHSHVSGSPLDYNKITDHIYVGSNQCCMMGLAEVLKNEGITADISLEEERLDQPFGVESYLWLPTPDHTPPTQDQLGLGAEAIESLVKRNKKVYVHCKHGHGRAATLVAAYLVLQGKTPQEAEDLIKSKRPTIHLQESQREALNTFLGGLKKGSSTVSDTLFTCPACGLQYRDQGVAKQCQAWCEEHHSCNLDIIQHAVK